MNSMLLAIIWMALRLTPSFVSHWEWSRTPETAILAPCAGASRDFERRLKQVTFDPPVFSCLPEMPS
jgi:hypothetical protein